MQPDTDTLDKLVKQVCEKGKYAAISPEVIRNLGAAELLKRSSFKEAVKSTRNKLHQVGSAYQEEPVPYALWQAELAALPGNLSSDPVREYSRRCMQFHASTKERLAIHEAFFQQTLSEIGPLQSILDLACGLNPLNIPWMPVAPNFEYTACDIYSDMLVFLNTYFAHFLIKGSAFTCDLTQTIPQQTVQLALLLKTIPCLEQIDKQVGIRLLAGLKAENVLVTFPAHSLAGRSKGMVKNYTDHFNQLVEGKPWHISRFEFPGELAFLIRK